MMLTSYFSLARLIESCDTQVNDMLHDRSEFLVRRLDKYSRTLSIIVSRFTDTYGHIPSRQSCLENLRHILCRTVSLQLRFEHDCYLDDDLEDDLFQNAGVPAMHRESVSDLHMPGRPRIPVNWEQLQALHGNCGLRWSDIARTLNISERTLLGMSVEGRQFSVIADEHLDNFVATILRQTPAVGIRMILGSLRQHGITVQRHCVIQSIHRVDPVTCSLRNSRRIIRRSYNVVCPNALWYVRNIMYEKIS